MAKITPLMEQYLAIKKQCQDSILFFRMGDFYEMFYDDAKTASEVLGITLTSRGAAGTSADIPLAGFPHHALDVYLTKMLAAGKRVAICEQVEDPKKAKGVVKRSIVERVSPGTTFSERLLDQKSNNYLACAALAQEPDGKQMGKHRLGGVALLDITTGDFKVLEGPMNRVMDQLKAFHPAEVLVPAGQEKEIRKRIQTPAGVLCTLVDDYLFAGDYARESLLRHFGTTSLKGFGCEDLTTAISAAGAMIQFLGERQMQDLSHVSAMSHILTDDHLFIDENTRRNLELLEPLSGAGRETTLIGILDESRTPMGARALRNWILAPLRSKDAIDGRLDAVEALIAHPQLETGLSEQLKGLGDLERQIVKVVTNRSNARDILALAAGLERVPHIRELLRHAPAQLLETMRDEFIDMSAMTAEIRDALVENPPAQVGEGGLFREGYNVELDELRTLSHSSKQWIAALQESERERTGIPSLKVNFNKVFGYYIEVTKTHLEKVPAEYIRKQTLTNAERYVTPEIKEYEEKIFGADERIGALELELFQDLRVRVAREALRVQQNARALGFLDVLVTFAYLAVDHQYVRPQMTDGNALRITGGRHPVVERLLPAGERFIANDVSVDVEHDQILLITGPNMAGKSTYLRQVGLITLMAQMGCFVPAEKAEISIVDRVFTRVGASDNLARGESTFLVEMNELALILNNATDQSLILLDEIGRGTSTFDGLSIAWATTEYLHNNPPVRAKTLFATHYHELTELEQICSRVRNYNVAVKEWGENILFLRKIEPGGCDHSYGIQVARMAGVPKPVIERAKKVLSNLEEHELTPDSRPRAAANGGHNGSGASQLQISLYTSQDVQIINDLKNLDLDDLSPRQAHELLQEYQRRIDELQS
jgi:DNA mismatch repair protein MutS